MQSKSYHAPFFPDGAHPMDAAACERLLSLALEQGGDHADLFFEYCAVGSYAFEEGILKSASRSVSLGLGVRVQLGDATGYAYTQELSDDKMQRVARVAGQIARSGQTFVPKALCQQSLLYYDQL